MRAVVLVLVAAACALAAGCRDDVLYVPPDLSSPLLYCPSDPPLDSVYPCDPGAIPFCTYPVQQTTCFCKMGPDAMYLLSCGPEVQPDGGEPTGTGT
jgi:hypothetical protein